jgi:hypothetical protein
LPKWLAIHPWELALGNATQQPYLFSTYSLLILYLFAVIECTNLLSLVDHLYDAAILEQRVSASMLEEFQVVVIERVYSLV